MTISKVYQGCYTYNSIEHQRWDVSTIKPRNIHLSSSQYMKSSTANKKPFNRVFLSDSSPSTSASAETITTKSLHIFCTTPQKWNNSFSTIPCVSLCLLGRQNIETETTITGFWSGYIKLATRLTRTSRVLSPFHVSLSHLLCYQLPWSNLAHSSSLYTISTLLSARVNKPLGCGLCIFYSRFWAPL